WPAVRLLHAGDDRPRPRAPRAKPRAHPRRDPRDPWRQPLHVHGLRQHRTRRRSRGGRGRAGRAMIDGGWVGRPVPVKEDERLVAGRGRFLDDVTRGRMLHVAMLRSPHAHARIVAIDARGALEVAGAFAVVTGADAAQATKPIRPLIPTPVPI